jgi:hypothetical protein
MLISVAIWRLRFSDKLDASNRQLAQFGLLVAIGALLGYQQFLQLLSYLPRSWYYVALLSLLAVALDALAVTCSDLRWIRTGRVAFAAAALAILPFNAWPKIMERQTNVDIISRKLSEVAKNSDLIVVAPWQYGITFNRYYRGAAPWITLPAIDEHRVHRYDLLQQKMASPHPIDDVLGIVRNTLASGNRVWFVGGIRLPQPGERPRSLPPAPATGFGWDNVAYSESWREQLGAFVRAHAERGQSVPLSGAGPVNDFENVSLAVAQGWQD